MLFCSMLEINDVVLYCIVRMHLQGLYQYVIPRNLFAYIIAYKNQQDGGYRRAHVKIITQINSILKNIIEMTLNNL